MGPLINAGRLAEMEKIVAGAVAAGAKLATGGARAAGFNSGHFFEPTVLTECTDDMGVMADENFGPIAAITRFAIGRRGAGPRQCLRHGAVGLCLHHEPGPRAAHGCRR